MLSAAAFIFAALASAQDAIGSTGCTAPVCIFSNPSLRFGTGAETSVNNYGLFQQPWYYSPTASSWYKLTYSNYPLDTAIGTGTGSTHWSGTTITNLYSLTPTQATTDYSAFVVDSGDTTKSVGHGKIVASRTFNIGTYTMVIQNTFSLGLNDSFVKIVTRVINNSTMVIPNVIIWTGTRDDFVGMTDVNTKTRGNLDTGSFVPITTNGQSSRAIMITNTNEGVLFYSETSGVMTAFASCCSFSNVYDTNPLTLDPSTPTPTDGSYAAILPLGDLDLGASASITWYYAAGAIQSLGTVAENVAAAQVADSSPAPLPSPSISASASATASSSAEPSATASAIATASASSSASATASASSSASATASASSSASATTSATSSASATTSSKGTASSIPSNTANATSTSSASASAESTATSTLTATSSPTPTETPKPVANPAYTMTLQTNSEFVASIIAINVATIMITFMCVCCVGCCAFIVYKRHKEDDRPRPLALRSPIQAWAAPAV
jgi:hypothetical protein